MPKVRTTMQPHLVIEVGEAEYTDLQRQGLLVEDPPAAAYAAQAKTTTVAKGKET